MRSSTKFWGRTKPFSGWFLIALSQCYVKGALVRTDSLQVDGFDRGGRNAFDDALTQNDRVLKTVAYQRATQNMGSIRDKRLDSLSASGASHDDVATEYGQGSANFRMEREVEQQAFMKKQQRDAGVAQTYQTQMADINDAAGLTSNTASMSSMNRRQDTDGVEGERQALFSHNTSQSVLDREKRSAGQRQIEDVSPGAGTRSFTADSARVQDYANILDTDIRLDYERDAPADSRSHSVQQSERLEASGANITPEGSVATNLDQVKHKNSQYAKMSRGLYEKKNVVDAGGTRDLRSRWEKDKRESDVLISNGKSAGRSADASFQGSDMAFIDGTVSHNAIKKTVADAEYIDDRSSLRLSTSEQTSS